MKLGHRTKGFAAAAAGVALVSTTFATAQAAPLTMEPAATDAVVVSEDFEEGLGVFEFDTATGARQPLLSAPTTRHQVLRQPKSATVMSMVMALD